jgi:hypothetical protein
MHDVNCPSCHPTAMDMDRYARDEAVRHDEIHYPNAEIRVAGSDRVMLDVLAVYRARLERIRPRIGRRDRLPAAAAMSDGR